MKTSRKILILVLALVMIFACAIPATGLTDLDSLKDQEALANASQSPSSMTVYLSIQSDAKDNVYIDRGYYAVNMTSSDYTNGVCRVGDVLRKAATTYSWLTFYDTDYNPLTNGPTNYVFAISDSTVNSGNTIFDASTNYLTRLGWMFRINRKYPILDQADYPNGYSVATSGPCSAAIETAIVKANDQIDLYYADAYSYSTCTRKLYVEPVSTSSGYGIRVYSSYSYYGLPADNNYWYVDTQTKNDTNHKYTLLKNTTLYVEVDGSGVLNTMTTNNNGIIIISSLTSGSGYHTVKVHPMFNPQSVTVNGATCYMLYYTGMTRGFTL